MTKERVTVRCDKCGKFISYAQIKNKEAKYYFKPLDQFGTEESYWTHIKCS